MGGAEQMGERTAQGLQQRINTGHLALPLFSSAPESLRVKLLRPSVDNGKRLGHWSVGCRGHQRDWTGL